MRFKMKYIYDIPKTVYFNFRVLPFKKAIKLPFYISHSVHFDINNFKNILIESPVIKRFMIRFVNGGSEDIIPNRYGLICLKEKGKIIFHGDAQFVAGCSVKCGGGLEIGAGFSANRNCNISCMEHITFMDNCLLGFHVSVRDFDGHKIANRTNIKPIQIGQHVWICANASILKGSVISPESVVAYNSCVNHVFDQSGVLLAGSPAKIVKENISWEL